MHVVGGGGGGAWGVKVCFIELLGTIVVSPIAKKILYNRSMKSYG